MPNDLIRAPSGRPAREASSCGGREASPSVRICDTEASVNQEGLTATLALAESHGGVRRSGIPVTATLGVGSRTFGAAEEEGVGPASVKDKPSLPDSPIAGARVPQLRWERASDWGTRSGPKSGTWSGSSGGSCLGSMRRRSGRSRPAETSSLLDHRAAKEADQGTCETRRRRKGW